MLFSQRSFSILLILVSLAAILQLVAAPGSATQPVQASATTTVCYQLQNNQFLCDVYFPVTQTVNQTIVRSFTQTQTLTQTSITLSTQTSTETSTYTQPLNFAQANWPIAAILTALIGCGVGLLLARRGGQPFALPPQPPPPQPPTATKESFWITVRDGVGKKWVGRMGPAGWDGFSDEFGHYARIKGEWIDVTTGKKVEKLGPPNWPGGDVTEYVDGGVRRYVYVDP